MRHFTTCLVGTIGFLCAASCLGHEWLSSEMQAIVQRKNGMTAEQLTEYLPYIYPRVEGPIAEGISLDVPQGLANRPLAAMGLVDVTAAPFSADASGRVDSTRAIQAAVDFARDHQMVLFFPAGTYRISDTIECRQKLTVRGNGRLTSAANFPCVLIGSAKQGQRSTILLAPHSPGFTDPNRRKIAVHFTNCNYGYENRDMQHGPLRPQTNINYNQLLLDVDIVIGEGNAGAVALRMQAAEGSSVQNVHIDATHGHTGMRGAAGSGGSHHHITIRGGRIGIDTHGYPPEFRPDATGTQPTPTMAGITLLDQTEHALVNKSRGPLVAVGWRIRTQTTGPVIRLEKGYRSSPYNGGLALIDSRIEFAGEPGDVVCAADKSFYMRDVYVRRVQSVVKSIRTEGIGWSHIEELAYPVQPAPWDAFDFRESVYINGKRSEDPLVRIRPGAAPPEDLCARHLWGKSFPSFQDPRAVNVKTPPYHAAGDGLTDDTEAIQQAVDENEVVFLPKGYYCLRDTLRLRPNTKLIGVAPHLSILMTRPPYGALGVGDVPKPLVETSDTSDANTVIAFLGIHVMDDAPADIAKRHSKILPYYALSWRCGGASTVRSPYIARKHLHGFPLRHPKDIEKLTYAAPTVRISGHGGGKWYNFFIHGMASETDGYRHILIENAGGPLAFYHLHAQHADSYAQCEIRNSANVDIYGVKTEYQTRFLKVADSDHIRIHGHGGNATAIRGSAHYVFVDSNDITLTNMSDQFNTRQTKPVPQPYRKYPAEPLTAFGPLIEIRNGEQVVLPSTQDPVLWRRLN